MSRKHNWIAGLILALCLVRLWFLPLPSSFWVDEAGTLFVVRMGSHHPSLAVAPQVPASLYFWLPRAVDGALRVLPQLLSGPGFLETFYRLPSVICMAGALWSIAKIAQRLFGPQAGWLAVFASLALRGFNYQADDARPYALGTLVAALSIWQLIRWLDRARWPDAIAFVALAALVWRIHLVYWPFYGVLLIYTAMRVLRKETAVPIGQAAAVFAVLGVTLLPVLTEARTLLAHAGAHVIVPRPGASELWRSLKFGLLAGCVAGAWIWKRLARDTSGGYRLDLSAWALLCAWWLLQPLSLFAFSWATGNSVFVDRYLSIALPGAALVASAGAARVLAGRWLWAGSLVLGVGVLLLSGPRWARRPTHHDSDWRGASAAIERLSSKSAELPVLVPSPFVEAQWPVWTPQYRLPGFLYAQLFAYPFPGRLILLPFGESPPAEEWMNDTEKSSLVRAGRFAIYGSYGGIRRWAGWLRKQPELRAWRERKLGNFGDVGATLFTAPDPQAAF